MRVLALYDIHGNIDALEAVLAAAPAPDVVLIGGDAVPGPFARATIDRLRSLDARVDPRQRRARGGRGRRRSDARRRRPRRDHGQALRRRARRRGRARARRAAADVELDGVLYCHATPRRDDEFVTRISSPERWTEVLGGVEAGIVVAGHTHQQDDRVVGSTRFVNAGSVGLPYEGDGAARWLWVDDGEPSLRRTSYDAAATGARMHAWPDQRSIAASLIDPVEPMVVTRIFEDLTGV